MAIPMFDEYKKNIKEFHQEEPFDYLIFRPLAFIILKATWKMPLRPNHFSLLAFFIAIATGYSLSLGTANGFIYGGMGIFLFSVLDCCDGMLARMKSNGSPHGDLIDMFVDLISNISFFTGLYLGLRESKDILSIDYLAWISGLSILLHASVYNFYKEQYAHYLNQNQTGRIRKLEKLKRELDDISSKPGKYFDKLLIRLYLIFASTQSSPKKTTKYNKYQYTEFNRKVLPMWGVISGSSHLFLLSIALMFHWIGFYFFFSIFLFNLWFLLVLLLQFSVNATIKETSE